MTANVSLVWADRRDVLRVPTAALRFRPPAELLAEAAGLPAASGKHKHKAKDKDRENEKKDKARAAGDDAAPRRRDAVWVLESPDRRLREVAVAVGVSDGTRVEVQDGELREGDVVLTDAVDGKRGREAAAGGKPKKKLF